MREQILKLKQELKELALKIKTNKPLFKESQRSLKTNFDYFTVYDSFKFRAKHIVYCLLRGRTIEQIERSNREGNSLEKNMQLKVRVENYMKEIQDEALRSSEGRPQQESAGSSSGACSSTVSAGEQVQLEQRNPSVPESAGFAFLGFIKGLFR
jgi:hypothetical protein